MKFPQMYSRSHEPLLDQKDDHDMDGGISWAETSGVYMIFWKGVAIIGLLNVSAYVEFYPDYYIRGTLSVL